MSVEKSRKSVLITGYVAFQNAKAWASIHLPSLIQLNQKSNTTLTAVHREELVMLWRESSTPKVSKKFLKTLEHSSLRCFAIYYIAGVGELIEFSLPL